MTGDVNARAAAHRLPRIRAGVSPARRWSAVAIALLGLPPLTVVLLDLGAALSLGSVLLIYLLAVVAIASIGGTVAAAVAAGGSFLLANWFFTEPLHTLRVNNRDSIIELVVFVLVALAVSIAVDLSASRRVAAERSRTEAQILAVTSEMPVMQATEDILARVQQMFGMQSVAVTETRTPAHTEIARVGPEISGEPTIRAPAGDDMELVAFGEPIFAEDRRLLATLAQAAGRAATTQRLSDEAAHAAVLAEIDRTRAALLAAVGHDLRSPLTRIKAAVSTLRQSDLELAERDREALLETVEQSTDTLSHLISNLLDMSRLEAGALSLDLQPVAPDEVVASCLILGNFDHINIDVPDDLPLILADAGLLERVLVNLIDNACRYSPPDRPPRIVGQLESIQGDRKRVCLSVIDSGPGIDAAALPSIFDAFAQLGDRAPHEGVGLGLAIAQGFTSAMGGTLQAGGTPGGGLTMRVSLTVAQPAAEPTEVSPDGSG